MGEMAEVFARLRAEYRAAEIPESVRTVERVERDAEPGQAGSYIRKTLAAVTDWPISQLNASLVHVSDEYRLADSQKKPGQEAPEHRKGDLKRAAHREVHWWVQAKYPDLHISFRAHWEQRRGRTCRSAPGFSFQEARCLDPIGVPVELFHSYEPGAADLKRQKDEPEHLFEERKIRITQTALQRDYSYNDGQSWLNRYPVFQAYKDFSIWLAEANEMIAAHERNKRKEAA